jgi:outer membrane immunogenic protein
MKHSKLTVAAAIAISAMLGVGTASAADLPMKALPSTPPPPIFSWTGFYIGLNAGGDWGTSHTSTTVTDNPAGFVPSFLSALNTAGAPASFDTSGFTGGIQGGYNWQVGNWLAGLEVDFEYFRSAGSKTTSVGPIAGLPGSVVSVTSSISTDWLFTARPRLGMIVANNWLIYATGGLAVTRLKASWGISGTSGTLIGDTLAENASGSTTKAGWVVGGGVETALPGDWLIGAEYLYVDFGSVSANSPNISDRPFVAVPNPVSHSADLKSNIARVRLSRKF